MTPDPPQGPTPPGATCAVDDGCITCGDVAVPLVVVEVVGDDARCDDGTGRTEVVATELVGPVQPGDHLLVHARVALERLRPAPVGTAAHRGDDAPA